MSRANQSIGGSKKKKKKKKGTQLRDVVIQTFINLRFARMFDEQDRRWQGAIKTGLTFEA